MRVREGAVQTEMTEEIETRVTPTKEEEQAAKLIDSKRGNISAVAKSLKVARKTVYAHIKASPYLQDVLADAREKSLDDAEDQLGNAVRKGEAWAVCFTLKTQGQERGYIEKTKTEVTGKDGGAIQTEVVYKVEVE